MATLTTPTYGFPYPDGTERVADGDNAMGALGLAIENLLKNSIVAARMERAGADQIIPTTADTDLALNTLIREDDPGAGGAIGPQPGNGSITLAKPGWWMVSAGVLFAANATGIRYLQLVGSTIGIFVAVRDTPAASGATTMNVMSLIYVAAAENVKAQVNQTSGGNLAVTAAPRTHIAAARLPFP